MTRSRLVLLLLLSACVAGCSQSSAVPSLPEPSLPAKPPKRHSVQKVVVPEPSPATIPRVCLSTLHAKWCVAHVGDTFPAVELPRLSGPSTKLDTLYGKQATVVVFWSADRWMSRMALEDLVSFVVEEYDPQEVAVVGLAVRQPARAAQRFLKKTKAEFPQLLDTNGVALAQVGSVALPRLYVLDPAGKIVWFDIEYSESTRRELAQTLGVLTAAGE
jgi:peroxiredoxin